MNISVWLTACIALAGFSAQAADGGSAVTMTLTSPAFKAGAEIPVQYTCEGMSVSPPLEWTEVPGNTKSLALIVDDPDAPDPKAPKMTFVHWVLIGIPPSAKGLPEAAKGGELPKGVVEGLNDFKKLGYRGPCPPTGRHRYYFKLYALDSVPSEMKNASKADLERTMEGHVLARAELIGTYQKKK